jgi:SWI/SNF-related matrix-associated actin-dependent regulator of chromatin subfamily A member 5
MSKRHDADCSFFIFTSAVCASRLSALSPLRRGLGKTLQAISLIGYLRQYQNLHGPHLVLVPLSTLGNWHREFNRWCPAIRCFKFHGTREERAAMIADGQLKQENWDVLLTSYEMSIREKAHINKVKWNFIIVDEGKRDSGEEENARETTQ